jgi:dynactin 1
VGGPLSPSPVVPSRKLPLLQSRRPSSPLSQPPESSSASSSPVTESPQLQRGIKLRPSSSLTNELLTTSSPSSEPSTPPPVAPPLAPVQGGAELQELRARVRVLEAKRADDARHVRELENRLSEAETFVALRPKLQAKLASMQADLTATKRELADTKQLSALGDTRSTELQDQLEMAMLDKEMAEERAEVAETELEEVKEKLAVLQVEVDVLRNGGGGLENNEEEADTKSSMAYIQLEKQNERLKEALMRSIQLRHRQPHTELTHIFQVEGCFPRQRSGATKADCGYGKGRCQPGRTPEYVHFSLSRCRTMFPTPPLLDSHESVLIMLQNAEQQVEDLKIQLDDALGAEEILVQLTERNLMLSEVIVSATFH